MEKEFETRGDVPGTKHSGTNYWYSFMDAYNAIKEDDSIWKLSFKDQQGINMRWRPKTKKDIWEHNVRL